MQHQIGRLAAAMVLVGEARHAVDDGLCRRCIPVVADHVPGDGNQPQFACDQQRIDAPHAEWRTEKPDSRANDLLQTVGGLVQLFASRWPVGAKEVGVRPGVVTDQVSCVMNSPHQISLRYGKLADQEECSPHVEARQYIQQLRSAARVRPVVEGQRNLIRIGRRDQALAKELRCRPQPLDKVAGRERCTGNCGNRGNFGEICSSAHGCSHCPRLGLQLTMCPSLASFFAGRPILLRAGLQA